MDKKVIIRKFNDEFDAKSKNDFEKVKSTIKNRENENKPSEKISKPSSAMAVKEMLDIIHGKTKTK